MLMQSKPLPHIILIIMDSASAKRFSLYGHFRPTSPNLERLAPEMMVYRHCFTPAGWTIPSHISLFTGLYPGEHGCSGSFSVLPKDSLILSETLRDLGYYTAAISSNVLVSPTAQFHRGYDIFCEMRDLLNSQRYYDASQAFEAVKRTTKNELKRLSFLIRYCIQHNYLSFPLQKWINRNYRKYLWKNVIECSAPSTERSLRRAKKILVERGRLQPVFLFINFMETHYNYNPPNGYNNFLKIDEIKRKEVLRLKWTDFYWKDDFSSEVIENLQALYDQEIAFMDDRLADLYAFLEEQGLLNNTLLAITADHGECLGEHGLWGHGFGLYNELMHIPFVVKYPESYNLKGESTNIVQLHDLFATIGEIADFPYPLPDSSKSLLGPPRDYAIMEKCCLQFDPARFKEWDPDYKPQENMQTCCAIIDRELRKLILWADGRGELYDLKQDSGEENNLIHHADCQNLAQDLKQQLLSLTACPPSEE